MFISNNLLILVYIYRKVFTSCFVRFYLFMKNFIVFFMRKNIIVKFESLAFFFFQMASIIVPQTQLRRLETSLAYGKNNQNL